MDYLIRCEYSAVLNQLYLLAGTQVRYAIWYACRYIPILQSNELVYSFFFQLYLIIECSKVEVEIIVSKLLIIVQCQGDSTIRCLGTTVNKSSEVRQQAKYAPASDSI